MRSRQIASRARIASFVVCVVGLAACSSSPSMSPTTIVSGKPVAQSTPTPVPVHDIVHCQISGSSGGVPILMYHYIRDNPDPNDQLGFNLSVEPEHFNSQLSCLHSAGMTTVTFADVMTAQKEGKPLPQNAVILTFDDGYADFATTATPLLQRYHFIGVNYVVSGFLDQPNYMTTDQLHGVVKAGMVVGAHTIHHVDLTQQSITAAQTEIAGSRTALQQLTGTSVDDFAYPAGKFSADVEQLVSQAGFRDAVTTVEGVNATWAQPQELERVRIEGGDTLDSFAAKLSLTVVS